MTGVNRNTILQLIDEFGGKCSLLMNKTMVNLEYRAVQVDEICTFVKKK
jgi:hypothetical protein